MNRRATPATQGGPDGLCGFYSLFNHVRHWEGLGTSQPERDEDAFRYLLEATERLGLLSARRIAGGASGGFEWHELLRIFNNFARNHRYKWTAVPIVSVFEAFHDCRFPEFFEKIFQDGCQAVVAVDSSKHWVLAYAPDGNGKILVDDSASRKKTEIKTPSSMKEGIVLCPNQSFLACLK